MIEGQRIIERPGSLQIQHSDSSASTCARTRRCEAAGSDVPGSTLSLIVELMSETSILVSNTVRMRTSARLR